MAGIEGSGHHALKSVWLKLTDQPIIMVEFDQILHSFGIENEAGYHYSDITIEAHETHMRKFVLSAAKTLGNFTSSKRPILIDAQNSYPMGMGAGSLAHPDLLMMTELDGRLFDLRVIILQRNPVHATLSAVRRFKIDDPRYTYKGPSFQARMVSESLAHLNNVIPSLPCGKFMVLNYESFSKNPGLFGATLAELSNIPVQSLMAAFADIKAHRSSPKRDEHDLERELDLFFSYQSVLWPLLAADYHKKT